MVTVDPKAVPMPFGAAQGSPLSAPAVTLELLVAAVDWVAKYPDAPRDVGMTALDFIAAATTPALVAEKVRAAGDAELSRLAGWIARDGARATRYAAVADMIAVEQDTRRIATEGEQ